MSAAKSKSHPNHSTNTQTETEVEVLYQKVGNRWYSFYLIEDDVVMNEVDAKAVEATRQSIEPGSDLEE